MADKLTFRILTPGREVLAREVDSANVSAALGEIGVLPGHAAFLSTVRPGVAYFTDGEETHFFALGSGFVEVSDDIVTALVHTAEPADEIDLERAEERMRERETELKEQELKDFQMRSAEVSLEKQVARATAIRLHRGG